jgi:hypothetical protein
MHIGAAERHFDAAKALQELASYHKDGPGPTTRLLRDGLVDAGVVDGLLIDVGAGRLHASEPRERARMRHRRRATPSSASFAATACPWVAGLTCLSM